MSNLKLAIQKKGRLNEKSISLLKECGISFTDLSTSLKTTARNFPLEVLLLRDDDIPQYIEQGIADIGILGLNEVLEKNRNVTIAKKLGFGQCRLSLALPKEASYDGPQDLAGKRIATSYPLILEKFLEEKGIQAQIEQIGGSVEIAPSIGLSEAVFDIVSTGSTLLTNGLKEVEKVLESEAVLISSPALSSEKEALLNKLLFRIDAVLGAREHKYILLNAPNGALDQIIELLPGMKSPTVLPLATSGWSSLHTVIREDSFWEIIDELQLLGAEGILVVPIEKMIR